MSETIGVIGLGEMGGEIVRHWVTDGYEVYGYDLDESKCDEAAEMGATIPESAADLADRCDVTLVMVGTGDQVDAALFSSDGVNEGVDDGDVVIVSSTVHPVRCSEWSERLADGVSLVDAPIARGRSIAERDTMVFAGGEDKVIKHVKLLLESFSRDFVHLGGVGTGQMGKTANNQLLWACHTANYDALRLAKAYGVDVDALREGLKKSSGNNYALHRWEEATGKWAEDDLRIVFEMADQYDVKMPQTERTRDAMTALDMDDIWNLRWNDYRDAYERSQAKSESN
jgi:3-hydroxyisobutyrate dehydrogenase